MSFALGTARGKIEVEYDGTGVKDAEKDIGGLKGTSAESKKAMKGLSTAALAAGLAVAGGFALAVNSAASFEQRMSAVQAVSGASADELTALSEKALQLGKDTAFSAGESASAMEELVKAGVSVEDVLNGAADATVALAAAGAVDMPTAAGIASAAMNSFQLSAKDATRVADLMAGAANTSATDVQGVGEAFKYVAPLAAATGITIEDTTTAIAALAKAGISGSMAGTTMRAMLQNLNPASKAAADSMKQLGIITKEQGNRFFDAQGNTKSMAEISGILGESLKGLSDKQKSQALSTIFGARAMTGAIALANQGEKGFNKLSKAVVKTSAADVAATRMDNLKGSLEQLSGSLETAAIAIGTILLPAVRRVVDMLTGWLNAFLNLDEGTQKVILAVIGVVGAILLIVGAGIKIILLVGKIQVAMVALRGTMIATWAATLGPILLVIAVIALIIGIIVLLWKKNETFRKVVTAVWEAIKTAVSAVAEWFTGTLVPWLIGAWDAITAGAVAAWTALVGFLKTAMTLIWNVATTPIRLILAFWMAVWGLFGPAIKAVFGLIVAIVRLGFTILKGLFILYLRGLKLVWTTIWRAIMAVVRPVWNFIWGIIRSVLAIIVGVVRNQINMVKAIIKAVWDFIKSATQKVWNGLIKPVVEFVSKAVEKVRELRDKILGVFADAATWLYDAGKKIIQGLIDGVAAMANALKAKVEAVTGVIGKLLPGSPVKEGPLRVLNRGHAGKQIVQMLIDGIDSKMFDLQDSVSAVTGIVPAGIAPVSGKGKVTKPPKGSGGRAMRMEGELTLKNGRAYISGIAQDVVDDNEEFDSVRKGQDDG